MLGTAARRARALGGGGLLALAGIGVEPGLSDVFARYAADHLFAEIDEVGVRDGADLVVEGYDFAPTFSIWTTIEECLNPPLVWERERGFYTTEPFSRAGGVRLPGGDRADRVRQRRARGGRARAARDRLQARHLQVRARRGVHRRAQDAAQAGARLEGAGRGARRRGRAARRRRGRAARSGDARRPDARQDLRRHARHRHADRTASERATYLYHVSDNERDDARVRLAGGRAADRAQPGRRARAARERHVERSRACSARRRSTPMPFLDLLADYGEPHGQVELR